jgi:aminomethyltransferase
MGKKTFLYDTHVSLGAKMVDFGGWDMPVNYGSQIEEHHAVRRDAGMFDVSHMRAVDIEGRQARDYVRRLLANDVAKLKGPGRAIYGCMLNHEGGVIDDMITYYIDDTHFRVVVNASTTDKDLDWMEKQSEGYEVTVSGRDDLGIVAVQGPTARDKVFQVLPKGEERERAQALKRFQAGQAGEYFIARTGYTGEDGFEVILPGERAAGFWRSLQEAGVQPAGLGARDTLRLEAGLNLYGQDMDENVTPLESGLGWTVAFEPEDRAFIGREALQAQRDRGLERRFVGLVLLDKGILRHGMKVLAGDAGEGEVTSGGYSPTLGVSIAFARVPRDVGEHCEVEVRGRRRKARVVRPPFVRNGEAAEGILPED